MEEREGGEKGLTLTSEVVGCYSQMEGGNRPCRAARRSHGESIGLARKAGKGGKGNASVLRASARRAQEAASLHSFSCRPLPAERATLLLGWAVLPRACMTTSTRYRRS